MGMEYWDRILRFHESVSKDYSSARATDGRHDDGVQTM